MAKQIDYPIVTMGPMIDKVEGIKPKQRENARSIAEKLGKGINDRGYDEVYDDITSNGDGKATIPALGNAKPINLIPGQQCENCYQIVVALAKGSDAESVTGFPQIMRKLRSHLIRCSRKTKVVFLVTDVWDETLLKESRQDVLAHEENGVLFLVFFAEGKDLTHPSIGQ